jgi:DNA-binding transcriptional MerR regulator
MAFPVPIASVLTGASPRQLAYWRRPTATSPPLLVPAAKRSGRYLYSWGDIVALRSIVYLRQEKSLHKIRRAVKTLRTLEAEEWEHLSRYHLVSTPSTILVRTPSGQLLDLEKVPGSVLDEVLMADILDPFETREGTIVPALSEPAAPPNRRPADPRWISRDRRKSSSV